MPYQANAVFAWIPRRVAYFCADITVVYGLRLQYGSGGGFTQHDQVWKGGLSMATPVAPGTTGWQPRPLAAAEFSQIVSIAFDAFVCTDERQHIVFFNEAAGKMFGYSKAEIIGQPLDILLPDRFRKVHDEHVAHFGSGAACSRRMAERGAALVGLRKNGEEFPVEISISRMATDHGPVLTAVCRDINERKRAAPEQQVLAELGAVLVSSLDYEETLKGIASLAVKFLADWCIVDVFKGDGAVLRLHLAHADPSQAPLAEEWRRIEREQAHGLRMTPVLATAEPFLATEIPRRYIASIAPSAEYRRLLERLGPASILALPLLAQGRLLGAITFLSTNPGRRFGPEDLRIATEVVHRAALAIENARLYRSAREAIGTRDEVLGIVAHDLRNPLHSIGMAAEMLSGKLRQDDAGVRRLIDTITHASERANRLIRDLLEVSRFETGRLFLERTRQPIRELLLEAVEMLAPAAQAASLGLTVDAPENLPLLYLDRDRILQVLTNLIGNSIKFTPSGGRITVAAATSGREVRFSVKDTGAGMAPAHLKRIFDRFYQVDGTDQRGAGLGLHIAKVFIEAHGGRIWCESRAGSGTTMFFVVPLEPRKQQRVGVVGAMKTWLGRKAASLARADAPSR